MAQSTVLDAISLTWEMVSIYGRKMYCGKCHLVKWVK